MRLIRKVLFFLSLFLVYIIIKEFVSLYAAVRSIHPIAGYVALVIIGGFIIFILSDIYRRLIRRQRNKKEIAS